MDQTAKVLVVDDTPQNARLLEAMLSPRGYSVVLAHSGLDGLEKVRTERPDLVLLDIVMPDISGYEVCRRLREDPETRLLPVVMMTSSGDQDKVDTIEAGADDFIARPFNPSELLSRVRSLLRIKTYHDTIQAQAAELADLNRTLEDRVQRQVAELEGLDRLRRFFSPQVAEVILDGGGQMLETHRREVTIVFWDLRGFTAFSATAEPEETMSVLNQFYGTVGHLILDYQATLEQFVGDSIMAIVNDPVPCVDHTAQAVRMAVDSRDDDQRARSWLALERLRPRCRCRHRRGTCHARPGGLRGPVRLSRHRDGRESRSSALCSGCGWPDPARAEGICRDHRPGRRRTGRPFAAQGLPPAHPGLQRHRDQSVTAHEGAEWWQRPRKHLRDQ